MGFILQKEDKVSIVSPSRQIQEGDLDSALKEIKAWGLSPIIAPHAYSKDGYFAGTDGERRSDLQGALDDPQIRAVFCSRGGYGMTRILDGLDLGEFMKNPKPVIGFSDITALHLKLAKQ
jgi:muramoyltetrapeptide carboxypeptidase